jgi:coproporphyrinogen III oxidase-like Fe-S oxidoreductase
MMEYADKYEDLLNILMEEIEIDGKKYFLKDEFEKFFVKGNKTAATRIRKIMQIIKKKSQEIRDDVQEYKKAI